MDQDEVGDYQAEDFYGAPGTTSLEGEDDPDDEDVAPSEVSTSVEGEDDEEDEDREEEEEEDGDPFDPAALQLKEISNLAHVRVSSYKPGNGVPELLSDDPGAYWQSDGLQPHYLTLKFTRMVEIRALRFYVDHNLDESYTPTLIHWFAGTSEHDLIKFAETALVTPTGWQDVDVSQSGGGEDGQSLCCFLIQMQVKENHQNGKDTHIRGLRVYGIDEAAVMSGGRGLIKAVNDMVMDIDHVGGDPQHRRMAADIKMQKSLRAQHGVYEVEDGDTDDSDAPHEFSIDSITRSFKAMAPTKGVNGWASDFMAEPVIR